MADLVYVYSASQVEKKLGYMLIDRYHFPPHRRFCMYGLVLLLGTLYPDENNTAAFNAITTLDKS
jgi:hypothetical protein